MFSTWIETAARGRLGGPVRAGMWSSVVVGTNPIEPNQEVWLEISADDIDLGPLPAYWLENKGPNSLWHVPVPPQAVNVRLHYRSAARHEGEETVYSQYQHMVVRPNLPDRTESVELVPVGPEGLVGNRMMTVRVDARGSTYDVYYPTVGLHSDVRPAEGDLPHSRRNFRAIMGGLAVERRLDWFSERRNWEAFQHYLGATNLLMTELTWRNGPVRVLVTDFCVMGDSLPRSAGGSESHGQYIKRFRIKNEGTEPLRAMFGVYIQAEVNGGVGEPALSWEDGDRTLLAANRGHAHSNRKLARDSTVEFAVALDGRGETLCEPTGPNEAMLLRWVELPVGEPVTIDVLVSGAFTGWKGDPGTFEFWLKPALGWFRSVDLDHIEQNTSMQWDSYIEPLPSLQFPKPSYAVTLRRSSLAMALHADATEGSIAAGFDRGLSAYCWPRAAMAVGATFDRLGLHDIGKSVYRWLAKVRGQSRSYAYWFQKYTIDGFPEWEGPSVDQTALIPFGLERHYERTGDIGLVEACWAMVEQAATVCVGRSNHPGLRFLDDLKLISSAGFWDQRFGAFLYSNAAVVVGLRAAARLGELLGKYEQARRWSAFAETIWEEGILGEVGRGGTGPGLVDTDSGRFLDARRLSTIRGLWSDRPDRLLEASPKLDVSALALVVPFQLLPASDSRISRSAEWLLQHYSMPSDPNSLARWSYDGVSARPGPRGETTHQDADSLSTLWMARYLIQSGRETGQIRQWNRALAMLDGVLSRLLPLGLSMRTTARASDLTSTSRPATATTSGSWALHGILVDTLLDLAGLDYRVVGRRLTLDPVLPSSWPRIGYSQTFACGDVSYLLERPIGGTVYQLTLRTKLAQPVSLAVGVTCPGLTALGEWQASTPGAKPEFVPRCGRLTFHVDLPEGESTRRWSWG